MVKKTSTNENSAFSPDNWPKGSRRLEITIDRDDLPEDVWAAIANGQLEHHPFKLRSASLRELSEVLPQMRSLPDPLLERCVSALSELAMAEGLGACQCQGRGLVYLRCLTAGRFEHSYRELGATLAHALAEDTLPPQHHRRPTWQQDYRAMLDEIGVDVPDGYVDVE